MIVILPPMMRIPIPPKKKLSDLLAVRKLDATASMGQSHEQFLQLVSNISKIQHANIARLVGYYAEHTQRLLCLRF
ncbi:hypothetical protein VNO77_41811 [Canavalia gladiata]|uniref:Serine-threonine/tyrosine-protein kinase catalytic domain-containing protein n=1 Tax=Canavalia gladiata TaxID=3824 RepID=A0AAN9PRV3_CANGL